MGDLDHTDSEVTKLPSTRDSSPLDGNCWLRSKAGVKVCGEQNGLGLGCDLVLQKAQVTRRDELTVPALSSASPWAQAAGALCENWRETVQTRSPLVFTESTP